MVANVHSNVHGPISANRHSPQNQIWIGFPHHLHVLHSLISSMKDENEIEERGGGEQVHLQADNDACTILVQRYSLQPLIPESIPIR